MRIFATTAWIALASAMLLSAANIDGVWKTMYKAKDGRTSQSTFHFKSNGQQLTGKIVGSGGEIPIHDGTIKGDAVSFTITRKFGDRDMTFHYAGTVKGDDLKLKATFDKGFLEVEARRQGH